MNEKSLFKFNLALVEVLAIVSILSAVILIAISSYELSDASTEFNGSESVQSVSSARHERETAAYNNKVGVFITQVCISWKPLISTPLLSATTEATSENQIMKTSPPPRLQRDR